MKNHNHETDQGAKIIIKRKKRKSQRFFWTLRRENQIQVKRYAQFSEGTGRFQEIN